MRRLLFLILVVIFPIDVVSAKMSDEAIAKEIIKESIDSYPGRCPCPYNVAKNGSSCGRRSAYSRAGGYSPLCYKSDISKDMIKEWRQSHE